MKVAVFSSHKFEIPFLNEANSKDQPLEIKYFDLHLAPETAKLAHGFEAIAVFVSDKLDRSTLETLAQGGTKFIALRSAGYNHVDLKSAADFGIKVARVPAYSPHAIAEHTLALILTLNRKTHKAYNRVREGNFSLEGLMGFDLAGKTVGVIGTGKIGALVCKILLGFGCRVLANDIRPSQECLDMGVQYPDAETLIRQSDIISLHCPLTLQTKHLVDQKFLQKAKDGLMLINTGRGALIDTQAAIDALKNKKLGYLGLDVYEEEEALFFEDHSDRIITDDVFSRLLTFPNVLITGHQAFFTSNAVRNIAATTLQNLSEFQNAKPLTNEVKWESL